MRKNNQDILEAPSYNFLMVDKHNYLECVAQAADFIEQHLNTELAAEMVAAHVGFSVYYFHRIFQATVGESIADYIRKRRLTQAAEKLQTSNKALIEIALESGFESQEAFTRAFKKMFSVTPGYFKENNPPIPGKQPTSIEMLQHINRGINMQPEIVTYPLEIAVGMAKSFPQNSSPQIGQLWERFKPRMDEIPLAKPNYCLGICSPSHPEIQMSKDDCFVYMAALPVSQLQEVPEGMTTMIIPAGRYAKFTHKGTIAELQHTVNYIWGTWLPKCDYQRREGPDFELYDQRFDPQTLSGEFDIYVPIQ